MTNQEKLRREYYANVAIRYDECTEHGPYEPGNATYRRMPNGSVGRVCRKCHNEAERRRYTSGKRLTPA